jgi:hypothetical protein
VLPSFAAWRRTQTRNDASTEETMQVWKQVALATVPLIFGDEAKIQP